ncbi:hypothetical protein EB796_007824 [Bugula neritina]|uniref:Uncharacterized protein n=1 Tax=Bugula neritina TaxID=10212 RepID=A0A7J7K6J6_BUGNE|nr:hypothetical protein EB796_007824 [Bugula neritina]
MQDISIYEIKVTTSYNGRGLNNESKPVKPTTRKCSESQNELLGKASTTNQSSSNTQSLIESKPSTITKTHNIADKESTQVQSSLPISVTAPSAPPASVSLTLPAVYSSITLSRSTASPAPTIEMANLPPVTIASTQTVVASSTSSTMQLGSMSSGSATKLVVSKDSTKLEPSLQETESVKQVGESTQLADVSSQQAKVSESKNISGDMASKADTLTPLNLIESSQAVQAVGSENEHPAGVGKEKEDGEITSDDEPVVVMSKKPGSRVRSARVKSSNSERRAGHTSRRHSPRSHVASRKEPATSKDYRSYSPRKRSYSPRKRSPDKKGVTKKRQQKSIVEIPEEANESYTELLKKHRVFQRIDVVETEKMLTVSKYQKEKKKLSDNSTASAAAVSVSAASTPTTPTAASTSRDKSSSEPDADVPLELLRLAALRSVTVGTKAKPSLRSSPSSSKKVTRQARKMSPRATSRSSNGSPSSSVATSTPTLSPTDSGKMANTKPLDSSPSDEDIVAAVTTLPLAGGSKDPAVETPSAKLRRKCKWEKLSREIRQDSEKGAPGGALTLSCKKIGNSVGKEGTTPEEIDSNEPPNQIAVVDHEKAVVYDERALVDEKAENCNEKAELVNKFKAESIILKGRKPESLSNEASDIKQSLGMDNTSVAKGTLNAFDLVSGAVANKTTSVANPLHQ